MSHGVFQRVHFFKMTGTGNDFILIDNRSKLIDSDNCRELVRSACRRKLSVGADGMILIENDPEVDFRWRFFNADASEAEMCGNGARCAARFADLTGIVKKSEMSFRTLAGIIKAEILDGKVKVQMTLPHGLAMGIHVDAEGRPFDLDFINTGVPHVISFVADERELESVDVLRWGHVLRFHPRFQPAGTNVNFVLVRGPHQISVRTYERGVEGETLACGTGVIASSLIAAAKGTVSSPVEAMTRSGESLTIHFKRPPLRKSVTAADFEEVYLEGEARVVYEADLWDETLKEGR
jgi:diaminopimelate epimerase